MAWNQAGPAGPPGGWAPPYGYGPPAGFGGWGGPRPPGPRGPPPGFGGGMQQRPYGWGPYGGNGPQMGYGGPGGFGPQGFGQQNFSSEPGVPGEEPPPPGSDASQQQPPMPLQQQGGPSWGGHQPVQFQIPGQRMPGFNAFPPQVNNTGTPGTGKKKNKKKKNQAAQKLAAEASSNPDSIPTPPGPPPLPPGAPPPSSQNGGQNSGFAVQPKDWPDSLKNYVSKCFNKCQTDIDKDMVEVILKGKITLAANTGTLWKKDWDSEAVPNTLSSDQRPQPSNASPAKRGKFSPFAMRGGARGRGRGSEPMSFDRKGGMRRRRNSDSSEASEASSKAKGGKGKRKNKNNPNYGDNPNQIPIGPGKGKGIKSKLGKLNSDGLPYFYTDGRMTLDSELGSNAKKQSRAARFNREKPPRPPPGKSNLNLMASLNSQLLDFEENTLQWEGLHVVGTCTDLEKKFFRLTSAPDVTLIRPLEVLKRSLPVVTNKWKSKQDYHSTCDGLKSIRQDLTVQGIRDAFTIKVYETHARVALEKGDFTEFNQCQTQLKMLYNDIGGQNRLEFTAYRILYYMYTKENLDLNSVLSELTKEDREDECLQHALKLRETWSLRNYHRFFNLYKSAPKMAGYLIDWFIDRERKSALKIMIRAYETPLFFYIFDREQAT